MELSTAQDLKGSDFSKVKNIIFDEFIIEKGQKKVYLQNEVQTFLRLLETLGRMRDIRVFMLGNATDIVNPYFLYFDLHLPYNNDIKLYKDGTILLQYMHNTEYRDAKKETKFGKLISGTDFENYSVENKFYNDNNTFIEKKQGSSKHSFTFIYNDVSYGVWVDYYLGKIYVSTDYDPSCPFIFACTLEDHKPNTLLLSKAKKYNCWKSFIEQFNQGNVYFENKKIKNICHDLIKLLVIR